MASPGVHFLGPQNDAVPDPQAADIFVLPSEAEGLSIAMLEAMSCALAPVLSRVGGALEVVTDEENGLLISSRRFARASRRFDKVIARCWLS